MLDVETALRERGGDGQGLARAACRALFGSLLRRLALAVHDRFQDAVEQRADGDSEAAAVGVGLGRLLLTGALAVFGTVTRQSCVAPCRQARKKEQNPQPVAKYPPCRYASSIIWNDSAAIRTPHCRTPSRRQRRAAEHAPRSRRQRR